MSRPVPHPASDRAVEIVAAIRSTFLLAGATHSDEAIIAAAKWLIEHADGQNDLPGVNKALVCAEDPDDRGVRHEGRHCLEAYYYARCDVDPKWQAAFKRQRAAIIDFYVEDAELYGEHRLQRCRALRHDPTLAGARIMVAKLRSEADALDRGQAARAA